MRIIFDIGHPAHVHHFKYLIKELRNRNHETLLLARDKDVAIKLLEAADFDYFVIGKHYKNVVKKAINQLIVNLKTLRVCKKFKPDLLVGRASPNLAFASLMLSVPFISFTDTEHAKINFIISFPFAKHIISPSCFLKDLGGKHIRVNSFFELAYLHPKYFSPDRHILDELGIKKGEKYVIMRFVSWSASHDIGHSGLSVKMKTKAVKELSKYARVFISSEGELPEELKPYEIKIPPERMHDALAFATLYIGEGATMASECAMLGTPAIYVNSLTAGTLEEQEKYGLIYGFRNSDGVMAKTVELLKTSNIKQEWQERRQRMLSDKIDVAAFMVWFIENYPDSVKTMKENPDYQYRFRSADYPS